MVRTGQGLPAAWRGTALARGDASSVALRPQRRRQAAASQRVLAGGGLRMSRRRLRLALKDARSVAGVTSRCN